MSAGPLRQETRPTSTETRSSINQGLELVALICMFAAVALIAYDWGGAHRPLKAIGEMCLGGAGLIFAVKNSRQNQSFVPPLIIGLMLTIIGLSHAL